MSDGEALLRAILLCPEDDTARLVYADWLDENAAGQEKTCPKCEGSGEPGWRHRHGKNGPGYYACEGCADIENGETRGTGKVPDTSRAERAEFIRLQIESERRPGWGLCSGVSHHAPSCAASLERRNACNAHGHETDRIRNRVRELLELAEFAFAAPVSEYGWQANSTWVPDFEWELRRGFVEAVSGAAESWLKYGDAIRAAQPVTRVTLHSMPTIEHSANQARLAGDGKWFHNREMTDEVGRHLTTGGNPFAFTDTHVLLRLRWPGVTFELPT
jgi:uncharacterized protein (TIGR02996 family)